MGEKLNSGKSEPLMAASSRSASGFQFPRFAARIGCGEIRQRPDIPGDPGEELCVPSAALSATLSDRSRHGHTPDRTALSAHTRRLYLHFAYGFKMM